ncbi:MAG: helix-turn-helix domain-containing protein [Candidatus Poribacteria bacterium]
MTKWVTVSEASVILGMSERTIWRHVSKGSIEAKTEGGRRYIAVNNDSDKNDNIVSNDMTTTDRDDIMNYLKTELAERNKLIEQLQSEVKSIRERSDTIIMKLTQELEAQRRLFQGLKPGKKKDRSFWNLLGKSGYNDMQKEKDNK